MSRARKAYYRLLFAVAAGWNICAAAVLIVNPDLILARLNIHDSAARLLARSLASSVTTWGIGYALIAVDQNRFRDFAWLGVISKSLFFTIYLFAYLESRISFAAFLPALVDLLLAMLFAEFLKTMKQKRERETRERNERREKSH